MPFEQRLERFRVASSGGFEQPGVGAFFHPASMLSKTRMRSRRAG